MTTKAGMKYKTSLTSGQVAKLLNVAARTVCQWCNQGYFPNYYRIPPGDHRPHSKARKPDGDRRIPVQDLYAFAHKRNIPLPANFLFGKRLVLVNPPAAMPVPLARDGIGVECGSFIGMTKLIVKGHFIPVAVVWPTIEREVAAEFVSDVLPEWAPKPILVLSEDGTTTYSELNDKVVRRYQNELDWGGIFDKIAEYTAGVNFPVAAGI